MNDTKISIVYDNQLYNKNLKSGWGFSCLVEHSGKKILFDTGDNSRKLSFNLKSLQVNPRDFEAVVLSHNHWDHTDGLRAIIEKNISYKLYFGISYPAAFQEKIRYQGINFVLVGDILSISEGIFVGPEMDSFGPKEIPLVVQTEKGLVIITGCAHPGILKMAQTIKQELAKDIYLILGGFHLGMSLITGKIIEGLKRLGVKKAAPCHCTGGSAINLFKKEFKKNFISVGTGLSIEI